MAQTLASDKSGVFSGSVDSREPATSLEGRHTEFFTCVLHDQHVTHLTEFGFRNLSSE